LAFDVAQGGAPGSGGGGGSDPGFSGAGRSGGDPQ
jgi:hypothetical protein